MKTFLFTAVAAISMSLCSQSAQARSWRVNSNPDAKANFASINDAMASLDVFNGDTIYLDPGCALNKQTISKAVTIIGPGYNLDGNEQGAILQGQTIIGKEQKIGHAKIEGCHIEKLTILYAPNLTIERCRITEVNYGQGSNNENVSFLSCFIGKPGTEHVLEGFGSNGYYSSPTINNCICLGGIRYLTAATITNNVFIGTTDYYGGPKDYYVLKNVINSTIKNNIIINAHTEYSVGDDQRPYYYKNNTIANTAVEDGNTISNNVLSTEAQHAFANYPNNKFIGATAADIFTLTGGVEAMYKLKEGSPAIGYGTNGYDCGAFSGPYPYVLSGRPRFLPYIYEAIIPNQPTDGKLNVTLKIKTQNE